MRNFGNDSFPSQHYLHHQLHPPTQLLVPPLVKMETYPLTKTIGVGADLNKQPNKSYFSPVTMLAAQQHSHQNQLGASGGNGHNNHCGTNNNGIPINLSHHHHGHLPSTPSPALAGHTSHLPTATAACPANRGPSPVRQQIPVTSLPYHPSHSPTLPVANTASPSELHSGPPLTDSNGSPPTTSLFSQGTNSSYHPHHAQNLTKMHSSHSDSPGVTVDLTTASSSNDNETSSSSVTGCGSSVNSVHPGPRSVVEVTSTHPALRPSGGNVGGNSQMTNGTGGSDNSNSGPASSTTPQNRIVSQNVNGTVAVTGIPSNESELQLFRVLQRANLLSYFDMMIELGGDDVQQLCEAGEAEFLEIMALIGMATKPLHVRRLQKALQEWMTQPSLFQSPVLPPGYQNYGVSHVDRTISHTQYASSIACSNSSGHLPHHPLPVIPIPHLISHNPISPYPAHNAPSTHSLEGNQSSNDTSKGSLQKNFKLFERSSSSPLSNGTTSAAGFQPTYLPSQQRSSSIPIVVSTNGPPSYSNGQGQSGNLSSSDLYQSCPSPSGSTASSSSTVSIKSHHHHHLYNSPSPLENSPRSPSSTSESGRSNKHDECSTSSELEIASPATTLSDHSNSTTQTHDNSSGTTTTRVASRSSSCGGSEPSSPAASVPSKGIISQAPDSPRPSTESVTNRMIPSRNNSVTGSASSSHDFSSLQDHEIQKLAETAMHLVRSLPPNVKEPKFSKKIETSSYEYVMRLDEDDPRKMDEIRRLSAIFGRSSAEHQKRSKSSNGSGSSSHSSNKPVSVLELAMNEAAAQLCKHVPAFLTKRDEMFNLSRQVIRDSGLPYAVICANSNLPGSFMNGAGSGNADVVERNKARLHELRNSSAHEERISSEFAAACKKIKLDIQGIDVVQDTNNGSHSRKNATVSDNGMHITEIRNIPPRKSPPKENIVTTTALKRMALVAQEYRRNNPKSSCSLQT